MNNFKNNQMRVAILWIFVGIGYAYHTFCSLMPAFAGLSIATDEMEPSQVPMMAAFMSIIAYLVPLMGVLCSSYGKRRWTHIVNFVLASISFIISLIHMGGDLFTHFSWGQAAVLPFISLVLALIIVDLWKQMRSKAK